MTPRSYSPSATASAALQATTVRHDDPEQIAAHGFQGPFHTAEFDFILKTRSSPDMVAPLA